jgi:hypothetical protein
VKDTFVFVSDKVGSLVPFFSVKFRFWLGLDERGCSGTTLVDSRHLIA